MAITFTEKFRGDAGGKAWRVYEVLPNTSTTAFTITANSIGMNYIDVCMITQGVQASGSMGVRLSTTAGAYIDGVAAQSIDATGKFILECWGW